MAWNSRRLGAVAVLVLAVLAECTPSGPPTSPSQTPSVSQTTPSSATSSPSVSSSSPSPSPTWAPEQLAAIKAVEGYLAAFERIAADPSSFTKKQMTTALQEFAGGNALESTVGFLMSLKENGFRRLGSATVLQVHATRPVDDGKGDEVYVTTCRDQRSVRIVDEQGNTVTADEFAVPEYNLRQTTVLRPPSEPAFRVFGYETINGVCP